MYSEFACHDIKKCNFLKFFKNILHDKIMS